MIFGSGADVLEAQRMQASYARFGAHRLERLLMRQERDQCERTRRPERVGQGHVTLTDEAGLVVAVAMLLRAGGRRGAER